MTPTTASTWYRIAGSLTGETLAGYYYDANHNLLRATNAVGDVACWTYDAQGRLTSGKTTAGLTTTNLYSSSGFYSTGSKPARGLRPAAPTPTPRPTTRSDPHGRAQPHHHVPRGTTSAGS